MRFLALRIFFYKFVEITRFFELVKLTYNGIMVSDQVVIRNSHVRSFEHNLLGMSESLMTKCILPLTSSMDGEVLV